MASSKVGKIAGLAVLRVLGLLAALALGFSGCRAELPEDTGGVVADTSGDAESDSVDSQLQDSLPLDAEDSGADTGETAQDVADVAQLETGADGDSSQADTPIDDGADISSADASDTGAVDSAEPDAVQDDGNDGDTAALDTADPDTGEPDTANDSAADGEDTAGPDVDSDAADAADVVPVPCADEITCTNDVVVDGKCLHKPQDKLCADNNPCTVDYCDTAGCVHENWQVSCDDDNACTTEDACTNGSCAGKPMACDDNTPCTIDSCNPDKVGCVNLGVNASCDDGNACTDDECTTISGCANLPNAATCSDGNACTADELCSATTCSGKVVNCDDGVACTVDSCDTTAGCKHVASNSICDDNNECTTDTCAANQGCSNQPADNGLACGSSSKCMTGMVCNAGKCSGGTSKCSPSTKVCFATACSESTGCTEVWAKDGSPCSDGEVCTSGDSCASGACSPGGPLDCASVVAGKGPCWLAVCTPAKGCEAVAVAKDTPCDDGQFCTKTDVCDGAGACVGSGLPDQCTAGKSSQCGTVGCDPNVSGGCTIVPANTGLACTPAADASASTGVCTATAACAPTDNTSTSSFSVAAQILAPYASGPQMARIEDKRIALAWLDSYEKGAAGDAAGVARQVWFATFRSDGLVGMPTVAYNGKASGQSIGSLQVLTGPSSEGLPALQVHLGVRKPGAQQCAGQAYAQELQAVWSSFNIAGHAGSSGSLPAIAVCGLGDPTLWRTRQVRFGATGPVANHSLTLENWTDGSSTWTLLSPTGQVVWSKPAADSTVQAHDLVALADRYVVYASGDPSVGLKLAVLDAGASGGPTIAKNYEIFTLGATKAVDVAIATPAPNKSTWFAFEAQNTSKRFISITRYNVSSPLSFVGMGNATLGDNLQGGPAYPAVATTDDGWAVGAWEDDRVVFGAAKRVVVAKGFRMAGTLFTPERVLSAPGSAGCGRPRLEYLGAVVASWLDYQFTNTPYTRLVPSADGLITKDNDLPPRILAAGTTTGNQLNPAVLSTPDGRVRVAWSVGFGAPYQLVERTLDGTGKAIDASPRELSNEGYGPLQMAPMGADGWIAAWIEPIKTGSPPQVSSYVWKTQVFTKADMPSPALPLVELGVGQISASFPSLALASVPGVSAAVLLSSGTTDTNDIAADVLRLACVDADGKKLAVVPVADEMSKGRAGIALRHMVGSSGLDEYWALWSEAAASSDVYKGEDIKLRKFDSQCQPIGPATILVAGSDAGNKSVRMRLPALAGTKASNAVLVWNQSDLSVFLGTSIRRAALDANQSITNSDKILGDWNDTRRATSLVASTGALYVAVQGVGQGASAFVLVAPTALAPMVGYSVGVGSQYQVALAESASGAPFMVYYQGVPNPLKPKNDYADVYLQFLPTTP